MSNIVGFDVYKAEEAVARIKSAGSLGDNFTSVLNKITAVEINADYFVKEILPALEKQKQMSFNIDNITSAMAKGVTDRIESYRGAGI